MMPSPSIVSRNSKTKEITTKRYNGFTCIGGFYIHQMKDVAIYEFEELFLSITKNVPNRKYEIIIFEKKKIGDTLVSINRERLNKFKKHFKKCVEVHVIPLENSDAYC